MTEKELKAYEIGRRAGRDEAVEIIQEIAMCNHPIYDDVRIHGKKCNPYTEALDDTIKALQDKK